jgi:hypothetical protein
VWQVNQPKQPEKVIVYRSQREAQMDEFWWSDGYITPTKAGDGMVLFILMAFAVTCGIGIYTHFTSRYSKMPYWKLAVTMVGFLACTVYFLKIGYHFIL